MKQDQDQEQGRTGNGGTGGINSLKSSHCQVLVWLGRSLHLMRPSTSGGQVWCGYEGEPATFSPTAFLLVILRICLENNSKFSK